MKTWKFVAINFDHMHMGDLLRLVYNHPGAEIVGVCDENRDRMLTSIENFAIPEDRQFTDYRKCMEQSSPDVAILCPSTAKHADYVDMVASYGVHVLVEKPFAASLSDADRMIDAMKKTGKTMVINWPLAWYPPHVTSKRMIDEGAIGDVTEVHYYDGNRGPVRHTADKVETTEDVLNNKLSSWWYKKSESGGSLQDYLGYGVTLGTWFHGGCAPIEVTAMVDQPEGLEVDEHSITVARYPSGLSKFETRWGTFTDPWTHQPQPKCGFAIVGKKGTITSYDYESTIRLQTRECPEGRDISVDRLSSPRSNPIEYLIHCLETGEKITGPLSPEICRIGQQIVDSSALSIREKRTVPLVV